MLALPSGGARRAVLRLARLFVSSMPGSLLAGSIPVPSIPRFLSRAASKYAARAIGYLNNADVGPLAASPRRIRAKLLRAHVACLRFLGSPLAAEKLLESRNKLRRVRPVHCHCVSPGAARVKAATIALLQ